MCQYLNLIEDVVNEYVRDNQMFTAHNVTVEVRKKTTDRVTHDEVKKEVHKMFAHGNLSGYNRTLANLAGVSPQPFVYYPLALDPNTYDGKPSAGSVLPTDDSDNTISSNGSTTNDSSVTNKTDSYELDSTDRLCIPASLVRQAGWKQGEDVLVVSDLRGNPSTNEMVLTQNTAFAVTLFPVTKYMVDSYDNIRITKSALQKAGVDGMEFDIQGNNEKVTVKKIK